ncbi:MAG TPA: hypothetical protein VFW38_06650 [Solirubrobacteraceae bacterium]|nr:hypothetical protein [Solirubrobacteraceae bacterium]
MSVTIDEITLADELQAWAALGFAVQGETVTLGRVRLRLAGRDRGKGILGWSLREVAGCELDGLPTSDSAEPAREPAPEHPNGVVAIDHVVAFSPQLDRTVEALRGAGLDLRRIREQPTPAGAPRQAFFRLGETILEVVQIPDGEVERAGGPDAPARFWGLALASADLQRTAAALGVHASEIRPAVQPGRSIVTLKRSAGVAVPVALMSAVADVAA